MASRSSSRRIAAPLAGLAARAVGGEVVEKGISHPLVTTQKLPNVPGELP